MSVYAFVWLLDMQSDRWAFYGAKVMEVAHSSSDTQYNLEEIWGQTASSGNKTLCSHPSWCIWKVWTRLAHFSIVSHVLLWSLGPSLRSLNGSLQIFHIFLRGLECQRDGVPLEQSEHCEGLLGHFEAVVCQHVLGKCRVCIWGVNYNGTLKSDCFDDLGHSFVGDRAGIWSLMW